MILAIIWQGKFERILADMGHRVSRRDLGRMDYAVRTLLPLVPMALKSGLGPRSIDLLYRFQSASMAGLVERHSKTSEETVHHGDF